MLIQSVIVNILRGLGLLKVFSVLHQVRNT